MMNQEKTAKALGCSPKSLRKYLKAPDYPVNADRETQAAWIAEHKGNGRPGPAAAATPDPGATVGGQVDPEATATPAAGAEVPGAVEAEAEANAVCEAEIEEFNREQGAEVPGAVEDAKPAPLPRRVQFVIGRVDQSRQARVKFAAAIKFAEERAVKGIADLLGEVKTNQGLVDSLKAGLTSAGNLEATATRIALLESSARLAVPSMRAVVRDFAQTAIDATAAELAVFEGTQPDLMAGYKELTSVAVRNADKRDGQGMVAYVQEMEGKTGAVAWAEIYCLQDNKAGAISTKPGFCDRHDWALIVEAISERLAADAEIKRRTQLLARLRGAGLDRPDDAYCWYINPGAYDKRFETEAPLVTGEDFGKRFVADMMNSDLMDAWKAFDLAEGHEFLTPPGWPIWKKFDRDRQRAAAAIVMRAENAKIAEQDAAKAHQVRAAKAEAEKQVSPDPTDDELEQTAAGIPVGRLYYRFKSGLKRKKLVGQAWFNPGPGDSVMKGLTVQIVLDHLTEAKPAEEAAATVQDIFTAIKSEQSLLEISATAG